MLEKKSGYILEGLEQTQLMIGPEDAYEKRGICVQIFLKTATQAVQRAHGIFVFISWGMKCRNKVIDAIACFV